MGLGRACTYLYARVRAWPALSCNFCARALTCMQTMCFPLRYTSTNQHAWPLELKKNALLSTQGPQRIIVNHSVEHCCIVPTLPQPAHIRHDAERVWLWDLDLLEYRYVAVRDITSFSRTSTISLYAVPGGFPQ